MVEATQTQPARAAAAPRQRGGSFELRWRNPERALVDYVAAVWKRRLGLAAVTAIGATTGLAWSLTKPNSYQSRASLMVHGAELSASAADAATSLMGTGRILPDQVVTAVEIIGSRVVLARVVDRLGYREILTPYQPVRLATEPDSLVDRAIDAVHALQAHWFAGRSIDFARYSEDVLRDAAVEQLDTALSVLPATRGTTIGLTYLHTSADGAYKILTAVLEESIRRYGEMVAPPAGKDWLDGKVAEAAQEEEQARAALQAFAEQNGTTDMRDAIDSLTKSLAGLIASQHVAVVALRESEEVLVKLRQEITGVEPSLREVVQEVYAPEVVRQAVQQRLIDLRVLRAAEQQTGSGPSPASLRIDRQIETLEHELASLGTAEPSRTVAVRQNPKHMLLDEGIRKREFDLIAARTQIPLYEQSIAAAQAELERHRTRQRDADRLQQRLKEAEAQHKRLRELAKTYDINSELDKRGLTNLRLVEPAVLPRQKEGPKRVRLLLSALLGSLALGITVVLVRVRMRRHLEKPADVVFALLRSDVVSVPLLTDGNLARFAQARRRGWE